MAETKTEKKLSKDKKQKQRDKAQKLLLRAHPETMRIALAAAHGVAKNVECPHCKRKFDVKVGDGSNKEILKELIQQVEGKPKQTTEVDLKATLELDNSQLLRLYTRLAEFMKKQASQTIDLAEAEFKAIEEPELPKDTENQGLPKPLTIAPEVATPFFEPLKPQKVEVIASDQYAVKE